MKYNHKIHGVRKNIITHNGRKIPSTYAICINKEWYDIRKSNPPEVVKINLGLFNTLYELYDPSVHIQYYLEYINVNYMLKYYDKNNKLNKFINTNELTSLIGRDNYKKLIIAQSPSGDYIYFETEEVANKNGYYESINSQYFVTKENCDQDKTRAKYLEYKNSKVQCETTNLNLLYGCYSPTYIGTGGLKYTYGIEIETSRGHLPPFIYHNQDLNLECVKDGSLRDLDGALYGGEYVTGVLRGDTGLQNLQRSLKEISKRCMIDSRCGIHVHVGSFDSTSEFSVLAYILALKTQHEILSLFPPSRNNNTYAGFLPNNGYLEIIKKNGLKYGVDIAYEHLFKELSNSKHIKGRNLDSELNKFRPHPGGRYTDRYSNNIPIEQLYRYKWLNFIPCNFNTRNAPYKKSSNEINKGVPFTLEFRCHSASMNYTKIKYWVLFCMCYVNYVENYQEEIISLDNITIEHIVNRVLKSKPKTRQRLITYLNKRKSLFEKKVGAKNEELEYSEKPEFTNNTLKEVILTE